MSDLGDAFGRHHAQVEEALAGGDPAAIKKLYVDLGSMLEEAVGDDPTGAPLLSLPETGPVVCALLAGVGGRLLDAGCGPMPGLSIELAKRDPARTMVAMDIGLGTVRLARSAAARSGVTVLPIVGDLEHLPFRSAAFDGGVCDDTIEHVPHDALAAAELSRCMRVGAQMVIATPNRRSAHVLVRKLRDRLHRRALPESHYYVVGSHLREYTWAGFERVLRPAFQIRERAAVGWSGGGKWKAATVVTGLGPMRAFSRMLVVAVTPQRRGD